MQPLLGKNAFIQFLKDDVYLLWGCATELRFTLHTSTVNVATVTSGYWDDFEGDSNGFSIDLSGLTTFEEEGYFTSFDMLEAQKRMVGLEFKILFNNSANELLTNIYGKALITDGSLAGGVEFVNSVFTLVGKGEPIIGIQPTCSATITDVDVVRGVLFTYTVTVNSTTGSPTTYKYRIDGGAISTSLSNEWEFSVAGLGGLGGYGDHTIEIWPVCDNGISGTKTTQNFTTSL